MDKINTYFIGKVILHFDELPSTNDYTIELLSKNTPVEGTVISASNQTAGKGQFDSRWISEAGKNITLSLILYPSFLPVRQQFDCNMAISLAVSDFINQFTESSIKWPNDIYVNGKKIGGILIQTALSGQRFQWCVAGIGININQKKFPEHLSNATSLVLEKKGKTFDLTKLKNDLFQCIERRYFQLRQGKNALLRQEYISRLYRFNVDSTFEDAGGNIFRGKISGISPIGQLIVEKEGETEMFSTGEIKLLV